MNSLQKSGSRGILIVSYLRVNVGEEKKQRCLNASSGGCELMMRGMFPVITIKGDTDDWIGGKQIQHDQ